MFTILGAGVAGLSVATELAARGADVQVFDPAGPPGAHSCSWWAGGMLAPWCEFETAEEPVLRHGQTALNWWKDKTKVTNGGTLVVANPRDQPDLRRYARRTEGFDWVNAEDIAALEPDLHQYQTGLHFQREAHLAPRKALSDLYDGLIEAGV